MKARVITGLVLAVGASALVLYGPELLMVAVVLACAAGACLEYDRLFFSEPSVMRQSRSVGLVFLSLFTLRSAPEMAWVFFWLPLLVLSIQHVRRANKHGDFEQSIRDLSLELLGILYVLCMVGFLLPIVRYSVYGREFVLLLFFVVFAGDTFAFFVGSLWGKHLLANQISPKKSLEGALGGILGGIVFTCLWAVAILPSEAMSPALLWKLFPMVLLISLLAQVGDLFESMLKRSRARKDSGHFLPGHGGILDRLDGLTLSAPAFYFFLRYILEP